MIKFIKYFLQSIFIYFFFIIGKIIGLTLSRKLFSFLFNKLGNIFKSKKIIYSNLEIFEKNISLQKKEKIISNMWLNYGMTFIEYILSYFRKIISYQIE